MLIFSIQLELWVTEYFLGKCQHLPTLLDLLEADVSVLELLSTLPDSAVHTTSKPTLSLCNKVF